METPLFNNVSGTYFSRHGGSPFEYKAECFILSHSGVWNADVWRDGKKVATYIGAIPGCKGGDVCREAIKAEVEVKIVTLLDLE